MAEAILYELQELQSKIAEGNRDFLLLLILFTIRGAYRHRSTRWHLSIYTAHQDQAQLRCLRFRPPGTRFQSA